MYIVSNKAEILQSFTICVNSIGLNKQTSFSLFLYLIDIVYHIGIKSFNFSIWRCIVTWRQVVEAGQSSSGASTAAWTSRGAGGSTKWSVCLSHDQESWLWKLSKICSLSHLTTSPPLPQGFGDVLGEHWLGNEVLYLLTSQGQYSLRVELRDWEANSAHYQYDRFTMTSEKQQYR